jgi:hypothetical protein
MATVTKDMELRGAFAAFVLLGIAVTLTVFRGLALPG